MDIQELVKKRVNHRSKYGKGTIESICEIKNENPMLNVIFDSGETMRFVFPDSVVHGKYLEIEDSVLAAELEACLCEECGEINNNSKITDGKMLCSKCRNKYLLKQKQEEEKIRSEKESEIWKIIDKKIEYHAKHRYAASKNYNDLKLSEEEKEICKEIEAYKDNNKTAFDKFTIELENIIRKRIKETNYANIALVAIPSSEAYKSPVMADSITKIVNDLSKVFPERKIYDYGELLTNTVNGIPSHKSNYSNRPKCTKLVKYWVCNEQNLPNDCLCFLLDDITTLGEHLKAGMFKLMEIGVPYYCIYCLTIGKTISPGHSDFCKYV